MCCNLMYYLAYQRKFSLCISLFSAHILVVFFILFIRNIWILYFFFFFRLDPLSSKKYTKLSFFPFLFKDVDLAATCQYFNF